jgi:hypothetical protein
MVSVRPLRLVLSLLLFLVTIWFLVHREDLRLNNWDTKSANIIEVPFDARLNPGIHARRHSKILELDWVIRQELRSPDGVQKSIYTVNGLQDVPCLWRC